LPPCWRNPFDRLVSAYHFLQQGGKNIYDKRDYEQLLECYDSFEIFVKEGLTQHREKLFQQIHIRPQTDWIRKSDGTLCVPKDNLIRQENLETDFKRIVEKIGYVYQELPHTNSSNRARNFREYYKNNEMVDIVTDAFRLDLERFNYTYE
jgi:hypothetical protein